jgi:hypothetical protein
MASYFTRLEPSGSNFLFSGRHDISEPEYAVSRAEDIKGSWFGYLWKSCGPLT